MTPTSTVTVLFSDLVDSTARASALAPDEAEAERCAFFEILRRPIAEAAGTEVKNLGDGLMVTFTSAGAGAACAVATQQAIERHNRKHGTDFEVRIGLSTGDAILDRGDWFGPSIVEAARLCAKAVGGQILVSETFRLVAGATAAFRPIGALELKGLPGPVAVSEVPWEPLHGSELALPFPARLEAAQTSFVGRAAERAALAGALDASAQGERQVVLVCGEPGIGKTALVARAAATAREQGTTALYGRCEEDLGLPYQPFVEALDHYVAHAPEAVLRDHVAEHGGILGRLVPRLRRRIPGAPKPHEGEPGSDRAMLFAAVAGLLRAAADEDPVLLVLDDLHWADRETVQLLHHVIRAFEDAPLAVVGTYRGTDVEGEHPLRALVADLHREHGVKALDLSGLGEADVAALVTAVTGEEDEARARALRTQTSGNPFFVRELLRALDEHDDGTLPGSVRDVIARRVGRLPAETRELLATASVIGREFDLELLHAAAGGDEDEQADALDAAVRAALLEELPGDDGRFTFPHALIEYTLYEEIGRARRRRLHEKVALALEEVCGERPGRRVTELAHQWTKAAKGGDVAKALHYSRLAGDRALKQLAADEGVRWFSHGLELLDRMPEPDERERGRFLARLGDAQRRAGTGRYRETLLEAARVAEAAGDTETLVRAALLNSRGWYSRPGEVDADRVGLIERALFALGDSDCVERARLLSNLAQELQFHADRDRRFAVSGEALAIARRLDSPAAFVRVACGRALAIWAPETLAERAANIEEAVEASLRLDDPMARFIALRTRANVRIEQGDIDGVASDLDAAEAIAVEQGHAMLRWDCAYGRCVLLTIRGRLDEAERAAELERDLGRRIDQPDALMIYAAHLASIRFEQGRLGELRALVEQTVKAVPGVPAWRGALALATVQAGLDDDARALVAAEHERGFELPRENVWLTGMAMWAISVSALREAAPAMALYEKIAPFAGQVVFSGPNAWMCVDHHLGTLAAAAGRPFLAKRHLLEAARLHQRMGAPIWLERTQAAIARLQDDLAHGRLRPEHDDGGDRVTDQSKERT